MERGSTTPLSRPSVSRTGAWSVSRPATQQRRANTLTAPASVSKASLSRPGHTTLSAMDSKSIAAASASKPANSMSRTSVAGSVAAKPAVSHEPTKTEKMRTFLRIKPVDNLEDDAFEKGLGRVSVDAQGRPCVTMSAEARVQPSTMSASAGVGTTMRSQEFVLDGVFGQNAQQVEVYAGAVQPMVESLLEGRSFTVATYGMTGSGKTHTFWGDPANSEQAGIVPRFFQDLFAAVELHSSMGATCTVQLSFLELYNDSMYDLLKLRDQMAAITVLKGAVREFAVENAYKACRVEMSYVNSGTNVEVSIPGAVTSDATSAEGAIGTLHPAMAVRRSAATGMNAHSSRSHAVLQVKVTKVMNKDGRVVTHEATASLVDLAGSERQKRSGTAGGSLKEASAINHSLLTLGNVMKSLADQHKAPKSGAVKSNFKAWRDDLLTQLLHPCLDGNSRVAFLITISPDPLDWEQSLLSLDFARRAGQVAVRPVERMHVVETVPAGDDMPRQRLFAQGGGGRELSDGASSSSSSTAGVGCGPSTASPAIQKTARDVRLAASTISMLRSMFERLPKRPDLPAFVPAPAPAAGEAGDALISRMAHALTEALVAQQHLSLQVDECRAREQALTLQALHGGGAGSSATSSATTPHSHSGVKRKRATPVAAVEHMVSMPGRTLRPLRRRLSEEAFVGMAAQADLLGGEVDTREAAGTSPGVSGDSPKKTAVIHAAMAEAEIAAKVAEQLEGIQEDLYRRLQDAVSAGDVLGLQREKDLYQQLLQQARAQADSLKLGNRALQEFITTIDTVSAQIRTHFAANLDTTLSAAEAQLTGLLRDRRAQRSEIANLQDAKSTLELQVDTLSSRVTALQSQLADAQLKASTAMKLQAAAVASAAAVTQPATISASIGSPRNPATASVHPRAPLTAVRVSAPVFSHQPDDVDSPDGDEPMREDEEVSFHPRLLNRLRAVGGEEAGADRCSDITDTTPVSVGSSVDLFSRHSMFRDSAGVPALVFEPVVVAAPTVAVPVVEPTRQRRLVVPRLASSSSLTTSGVSKEAPPVSASHVAPAAAVERPRKFVDPYFVPVAPPTAVAAELATPAVSASASSCQVSAQAHEEAVATAIQNGTESHAAECPATGTLVDDENCVSDEFGSIASATALPPKSAMKEAPKRRNLLKNLIQTAPTG